MMANLFGDFVKGKDYSHLPETVQNGVLLHRQIDDYIDHHEVVKELRLKLFKELPKIAGIAIDLYMDHCLAKKWDNFHREKLTEYLNTFFDYALQKRNQTFSETGFHYPDNFLELLSIMHENRWIENYRNRSGLVFACNGLSKRISFPNNLDEAPLVFEKNKTLIEHTFKVYMHDAIKKFNIH